uniref:hypothetical protein n=1 Tax=Thaumasiovibrio occultus TaxID=1891184 RepID=UPI000B360547|nr:hypothetical protein [Thaumasiovibrio occultus]
MIALLAAPTQTDEDEWQQELADWGLPPEQPAEPELFGLWEENATAIEWWLSLPQFLRFNNGICLGMDIKAVAADRELSGNTYTPDDYRRLKQIAITATNEINKRKP